jgi:flagellar protein FlaG
MKNNINSVPANTDTGFMNKLGVNVDYTKQEKGSLVEQKAVVDGETLFESTNIVKLTESVQAESKINGQQKEDASEEAINKALEIVSSFINSSKKQVNFSHDNSSGKMVITVTDKDTQEVINQFPSEKIVSMAEKIKELQEDVESMSGLIIDRLV